MEFISRLSAVIDGFKFKYHFLVETLGLKRDLLERVLLTGTQLETICLKNKRIYIFSIFDRQEQEKILCSGVSSDPRLCVAKAVSEYCEYVVNGKDMTANRSGGAVHKDELMAKKNAQYELIERDSFLMHYFCPDLKWHKGDAVTGYDFSIKIYRLQSICSDICVVMGVGRSERGYFIGLGSSDSFESSREKAAQEVIMLHRNWPAVELVKDSSYKKMNLLKQHFSASNDRRVRQWLETPGSRELEVKKKISDFNFEIIKQEDLGSRLYIGVKEKSLLPLFFGDKFLSNREDYEEILSVRGLTLDHWGLHPLL